MLKPPSRQTRRALLIALLALAALSPACSKRKTYPDPEPGRHSPDYHPLFGRLQRIPLKDPDAAPVWIIRYGYNDSDNYGGHLNLAPPDKLTGYRGGELVQLTGTIHPELSNPNAPGTWFVIDSIRLWSGQTDR